MTQVIPLGKARICMDCEMIQDGTGNCSVCGSTQTFWLINWIPSTKHKDIIDNQKRKEG
jgi:hypothetical protein